jgi:NAD(P)-dependent dehydrogenase (short-subunit alcohol dehydrogenase family)
MRERRFGRIVNISSGTTCMVLAGDSAYSGTKSAVNMRGHSTSHAGVARRSGPGRRAVRSPSGSQPAGCQSPLFREG